jgi:DNA-binding transcriptional MerR regulator
MNKFYYTIGEVSNLLELKPYVIRFWETEFPQLKPRKDKRRNRQFSEEQIELLRKIKDMLYTQKFTIDGARQRLKQERKTPEQIEIDLFAAPPAAAASHISAAEKKKLLNDLTDMKKRISGIVRILHQAKTEQKI